MALATTDLEQPTAVVDARGLQCPMPLVRASQAMRPTKVGEIVKVLATDRGSVPDFQAWTKHRPEYELVRQEEEVGRDGKVMYIHYLRRVL
jgi:TusA-related sulfurtransferase